MVYYLCIKISKSTYAYTKTEIVTTVIIELWVVISKIYIKNMYFCVITAAVKKCRYSGLFPNFPTNRIEMTISIRHSFISKCENRSRIEVS